MTRQAKTPTVKNASANGRAHGQILGGATALASLGLGLASYAAFHEPLRVRLERLTLRVDNAHGRLPAEGLRILHLTDTHFRGADWRERPKMEQVRRICSGMEYDILVHTGDFLHKDEGLPNTLALLDSLPAPRLGAYAVLGNHDYMLYSAKDMFGRSWANFKQMDEYNQQNGAGGRPLHQVNRLIEFGRYFANAPLDLRRTGRNDTAALTRKLAERNIRLLCNQHIRLQHGTGFADAVDLYIAGVDDLTEGAPICSRALADVPASAPTLLLSHNPDIVGASGIEQADVVLSGHTHGGQIVLAGAGSRAYALRASLAKRGVRIPAARPHPSVHLARRRRGHSFAFRRHAADRASHAGSRVSLYPTLLHRAHDWSIIGNCMPTMAYESGQVFSQGDTGTAQKHTTGGNNGIFTCKSTVSGRCARAQYRRAHHGNPP